MSVLESVLKVSAKVDYLMLEVKTVETSNFSAVQKRINQAAKDLFDRPLHYKLYADPMDETEGRAATVFRVKFHDVPSLDWMMKLMRQLWRHHGFAEYAVPIELEIAWQLKDSLATGATELAQLVVRLSSGLSEPRMYAKSIWMMPKSPAQLAQFLEDGWVVSFGHNENSKEPSLYTHRFYFKTMDNGGKLLDKVEWHARLELTLREGYMRQHYPSLISLSELKGKDVMDKVKLRQVKELDMSPELPLHERALHYAKMQLGRDVDAQKWLPPTKGRVFSRWTESCRKEDKRLRDAADDLLESWVKVGKSSTGFEALHLNWHGA